MTNHAMSKPAATALRLILADGEKEANIVARLLT